MSTSTRRLTAAATTVAVLLLGACGGGSGLSRPSVQEVAREIGGGNSGLSVPAKDAQCVAELLVGSDLSDAALRRYTGENGADELSDADRAAFDKVLGRLGDCGVSTGAV